MNNQLSEHEVDRIAKLAVREVLIGIGVKIADPESVQKMQQDFAYLRDWREATATIKARTVLAVITIVVTGIVGMVWAAIRSGH